MKQFFKYFGILAMIAIFTISCDDNPSLQKYYVDSQESADFISLDIPASVIQLKDENTSADAIKTLESIKKVNFLGFRLTDKNIVEFSAEKLKVKQILKNPKYQELISIGGSNQSLSVKFLGEDDAIDEVIIFGSDKEQGFALVRVLGSNMDPAKMMQLAQEIKVDGQDSSLKQLESFIKNFN
jgi:hypothetical protein